MRYLFNRNSIVPTAETPKELYDRLYDNLYGNTFKQTFYDLFEKVMEHESTLFIHPDLLAEIENEDAFVPITDATFETQKLSTILPVLHQSKKKGEVLVIVRISYRVNRAIILKYRVFPAPQATTIMRKMLIDDFLADNPS